MNRSRPTEAALRQVFCYSRVDPTKGECRYGMECKRCHDCASCGANHSAQACKTAGTFDESKARTADADRRKQHGVSPGPSSSFRGRRRNPL